MDPKFIHDNQAIVEETGLPRKFVERCNSELPVLARYRQKKDKNKIYYDDDGLVVFRHIRKLYEGKKTMPQIRATLENELGKQEDVSGNTQQSAGDGLRNQEDSGVEETPISDPALTKIEGLYERMLDDKEKQIKKEQQQRVEEVKQVLQMLLPPGKTPLQVKAERDETQRRLADQEHKIKKLLEEKQARQAREQGTRDRRQALIPELANLRGWGKGKRRKEIINQLRAFEAET